MSEFENEVFGLTYERYVLGKLQQRLAEKLELKTVLEIPGAGVKAMPSLYSLGFGLAGCDVTLVNGMENSRKEWERLGIGDRVRFVQCEDLIRTGLEDSSFDMVWNFAVLESPDFPQPLLPEMKRIARKYVGIFHINKRNVGQLSHKLAHWWTKIPWTHGDTRMWLRKNVRSAMLEQGMRIAKMGWVDTPPWPDSIGFRDIRLHRMGTEGRQEVMDLNWKSVYVDMLESGEYPLWMKLVYMFESVPMPSFLKQLYAHLFYVIGNVE
jgi:hypothetical protein